MMCVYVVCVYIYIYIYTYYTHHIIPYHIISYHIISYCIHVYIYIYIYIPQAFLATYSFGDLKPDFGDFGTTCYTQFRMTSGPKQ